MCGSFSFKAQAPGKKPPAPLECFKCGELFPSYRTLHLHRAVRHGDTVFQCPHCEYLAAKRDVICGQHRTSKHPQLETRWQDVRILPCDGDSSLGSSPGVAVGEPAVEAGRPAATVTSETQFRQTSGTRLVELPVKLVHRTTTTTTTYPGGTVVQRVVVDLYERVDGVHQHHADNMEDSSGPGAADNQGCEPREVEPAWPNGLRDTPWRQRESLGEDGRRSHRKRLRRTVQESSSTSSSSDSDE